MRPRIVPVTYRFASDFCNRNHRHHKAPQGCKFAIGVETDGEITGVAICGRPVSRKLDDGFTLEVTRVCTIGGGNLCSMLYGACTRIANNMGYRKVITYTLASENGASLKASNFKDCGIAGGTHWTGCRDNGQEIPCEMKRRWEIEL